MPWIDVKLYDSRVTEESVPKIIESLTKALAESSGAAPDLEHVIPHPGHERPKLFPSHRFEGWHRGGGVSAPLQLAAALVIVGALVLRRKER